MVSSAGSDSYRHKFGVDSMRGGSHWPSLKFFYSFFLKKIYIYVYTYNCFKQSQTDLRTVAFPVTVYAIADAPPLQPPPKNPQTIKTCAVTHPTPL